MVLTKSFFFITEQNGRIVQQDATTIRLVHEAAPEIKQNHGIIVNMVLDPILDELLKKKNAYYDFLTALFFKFDDRIKCRYSNIFFIGTLTQLQGEQDK